MNDVRVRALIMVVSRTDAIEIAVQELEPEIVGVIVSHDILGPVVMKCEELGPRAKFRYRLVDSPMEIGHSFERFEHLLSELEELGYAPEDVVLDVTGGTTPMRFGAALAAMTRGMRMIHQRVPQRFVDGDWILDPSRQREIVLMDNPLESTGLLREGQAVELFNRRDYSAAALVFRDIATKVTGVERRHYYDGLLLLSEGYAAWDVADYGTALEKLRAAREELNIGYAEAAFAERAATLGDHIRTNLSFLGKLRGKKLSIENVVDMVENARRRIADQGRYDDGVARLYRAVEMWHQWRLQDRYSISTKQVDWERVDEGLREQFREATGLDRIPQTLDLVRARTLDGILGDEPDRDDNVLRDLLQKRNSSILAHGLQPISEGSAGRFLEYVDAMVDQPEIRASAEHARLREL
ncbi:TIGR02710 family CRISPR-associated CARF protein [soil metagenome]